ncbi:unnamed protein product [Cladocopium goreaui]|uniref:C2H2-type domain-containing protein n=1 Tax=Cladocopium goreaui TaxID=2562237 RepID=A0A9P1D6A6_9DINO|nr:unnamed protein product [Cladocopium goreaui]
MAYVYFNLAEPLAETAPVEEVSGAALASSGLFIPGAAESDLPKSLLGGDVDYSAKTFSQTSPVAALELMNGVPKDSGMQPRHLQHMSMEAFYELYLLWGSGNGDTRDDLAKSRCFSLVYEERWKGLLQFRETSQHTTLQNERDQLEHAQSQHIRNVRHYRSAQSRLNTMSEISTAAGQGGSSACILKLDIVVESYFVLEPDVPKDSSTEVTCILRALDQAKEILDARGVAMPSHLCIEDFVNIIHQKIKPSRKRELRAEILTGSLNWKAYYDQYDIYMSGLVKGPKSFLKTAEMVEKDPWDLVKAAKWERFAPGPVQAVSVAPVKKDLDDQPQKKRGRPPKDPNQPAKRRGRPPKNPPAQIQEASGAAECPFVEQSSVAAVAVPPPEQADPVVVPAGAEPMVDPGVLPDLPTRATFAGRTKLGSEDFQQQWECRRLMFYKNVPKEMWKDNVEREFWSMCSAAGDNDVGLKKFLEKRGHAPAAAAQAPKASAKQKAKAMVKKPSTKIPGRGRGRGRGCLKNKRPCK